ncbi:WD40-repeat-containing domain protein, partial [Blastocladiella britannica]
FQRNGPYSPQATHRLLEDYTALIVPNTTRHLLQGHSDNVKCIAFVGAAGHLIASGSSDNTVRLWRSETGAAAALLTGHSSRIWDVASDLAGSTLASAASDGTVRLWDVRKATMMVEQGGVLTGHSGDVYATAFHPTGSYIASGGYDRSVRVADTATGATIKVFAGQPSATTGIGAANGMSGHALAVTSLAFTPMGNLCVSGSKDNTLRFFDLVSGLCVRTLASHLGEVTAVGVSPSGTYLVTASKDNANRIWDLRMLPRPVRRLKGHTNTAKNFVRAAFAGGGDGALVVGGSEDGRGYCWDRESGAVVQTLSGHRGIVYDVKWNAHQQLMASCSDDHTVRTWAFDESQPMGERDLPARPSSS